MEINNVKNNSTVMSWVTGSVSNMIPSFKKNSNNNSVDQSPK